MSNPHRGNLPGYLLDALEPGEREAVRQELLRDPELAADWRLLRKGTAVLRDDDAEECEPPPGLARRTCDAVANIAGSAGPAAQSPPPDLVEPSPPSRPAALSEPPAPTGGGWRLIDFAVALAICLGAVAMVFPIVNLSRARSRVTLCANHLREIGVGLEEFSADQRGYFPRVEETGRLAAGGVYAPALFSGGYITDPREFVCPNGVLADAASFHVPSLAELQTAPADQLALLRRDMGGSYGYTLGYREAGIYYPTRNLHRETFAVASDVPSDDCSYSPNHGWMGQNVLLEDGHVVHTANHSTTVSGTADDDIFRNDDGRVAAGCQVDDSVIVPSYGMP